MRKLSILHIVHNTTATNEIRFAGVSFWSVLTNTHTHSYVIRYTRTIIGTKHDCGDSATRSFISAALAAAATIFSARLRPPRGIRLSQSYHHHTQQCDGMRPRAAFDRPFLSLPRNVYDPFSSASAVSHTAASWAFLPRPYQYYPVVVRPSPAASLPPRFRNVVSRVRRARDFETTTRLGYDAVVGSRPRSLCAPRLRSRTPCVPHSLTPWRYDVSRARPIGRSINHVDISRATTILRSSSLSYALRTRGVTSSYHGLSFFRAQSIPAAIRTSKTRVGRRKAIRIVPIRRSRVVLSRNETIIGITTRRINVAPPLPIP